MLADLSFSVLPEEMNANNEEALMVRREVAIQAIGRFIDGLNLYVTKAERVLTLSKKNASNAQKARENQDLDLDELNVMNADAIASVAELVSLLAKKNVENAKRLQAALKSRQAQASNARTKRPRI